jgi:hypothetical protein
MSSIGKVHDELGRRWHLPAEPSTLTRLLLRSQASRKEKRHHTAPVATSKACGTR